MNQPWKLFLGVNALLLTSVISLAITHDSGTRVVFLYCLILVAIQLCFFLGTSGKVAAVSFLMLVLVQPFTVPLLNRQYLTLPPNMDFSMDMDPSNLFGIRGITRVQTDDNGFRVSGNYTDTDAYLIFAAGASTTEQASLDEDETTYAILGELLGEDVVVVNTGVSGTRAIHHAATIRAIRGFDPDLILILPGVNDWNCSLRDACVPAPSLLNPAEWALTIAARGVLSVLLDSGASAEVDAQTFDPDFDPNEYYRNVMAQYDRKEKRPLEEFPDLLRHYRADFLSMTKACERTRAFCLFLTQPTGYTAQNFNDQSYRDSLWMTPPNEEWALSPEDLVTVAGTFNAYLKNNVTCDDCGILDLDAEMRGNREYFYDDVHFTEIGAQRVAQIIAAYIEENELLAR